MITEGIFAAAKAAPKPDAAPIQHNATEMDTIGRLGMDEIRPKPESFRVRKPKTSFFLNWTRNVMRQDSGGRFSLEKLESLDHFIQGVFDVLQGLLGVMQCAFMASQIPKGMFQIPRFAKGNAAVNYVRDSASSPLTYSFSFSFFLFLFFFFLLSTRAN